MTSSLLLGATGLVGRELLAQLLEAGHRVVVIARRPTGVRHASLEEHVFDLAAMEHHAHAFCVDRIFCALGTTLARAGSREGFRFVDHDLPILAARLGLANGVRHFLLVSALGARRDSRVFYNRVKGETEHDLLSLGYPRVTIARPSFLLGDRDEFRLGEQIVARLRWLLPQTIRPIDARLVARALATAARDDRPGVRIIESKEMRA